MARPLRLEYPGALYHITSRGNERKKIFLYDEDRKLFLNLLSKVVAKYRWTCHAYCLMDNHYHVLNPVRARIVKSPSDWKWSSFGATAGTVRPPGYLATDWILGQFAKTRGIAKRRYAEFVMEGIGSKSIWNGLKAKSVLGKKEFLEEVRGFMEENDELPATPRYQRQIARPSLEELAGTDDLSELEKRERFIRSAVDDHGYSQSEVARFLGINQSTVSRILGGGNA